MNYCTKTQKLKFDPNDTDIETGQVVKLNLDI